MDLNLLTILMVEDEPDDAELLMLELRRAGFQPRLRRVETEPAFLEALEAGYAPGEPWDLVFGDYQLPHFSGPRALELLRQRASDLPFILISGTIGEETAVAAMKDGAADYLLKGRLTRLKHAVDHALKEKRLRQETRAAERARRASEQRMRALIENSADGIGVVGADGRLSYLSPAIRRVLGFAPDELLGRDPFDFVHPDDLDMVRTAIRAVVANPARPGEAEYRLRHADGSWRMIHTHITNLVAEPSVSGVVFNYRDVSERKRSEEALRVSEERYRGLFEDSPIAMWEEDFSAVKQRLEALRQAGVADLELYLRDHPEVVADCAAQIRILALNAGVRRLYRAGPKSEVLSGLPGDSDAFRQALLAIASGRSDFRMEGPFQTLTGERVHVSLHWSALPGHEQNLDRVIVSALDTTERVQAETALKQRLVELEAVNRASGALRVARTRDEMLPVLVREAMALLDGNAGSIWLYDRGADEVVMAYSDNWVLARQAPYRYGEGIPGYVVAVGEPHLSRDASQDPLVPQTVRDLIPAGQAAVAVPIRAGEEVIGALFVNADAPREFTPVDAHLLTTLAEIGGNAIQRTALHEQTEQQLNRMTALRSVDQAISSSLDLRVTLNVLLDQATSQLVVDAADVLLLNPYHQVLEYIAGRGHRGGQAERVRMRLGEGRAGRAALDRRLVQVANLRDEAGPDPAAALVAAEGYVAYCGVPLLAKGQIKGVLEIYHRRPLETNQDWLDFLDTLAGQAAIAIDNAALSESLQRSNLDLTLAYDATLMGWSKALDWRDSEPDGQAQRVADLAVRLAGALGLPESDWVHLRRGALLHDVGNMGVPTNVLQKPGPLTEAEWGLVREHPRNALNLLATIPFLRPALDIPYSHHEKWDGSGYPRGLRGESIPLAARVFAVVDVWAALQSDRPYRAAWPREQVLAYLREQAGRHFDPRVVEAFLQLLSEPPA